MVKISNNALAPQRMPQNRKKKRDSNVKPRASMLRCYCVRTKAGPIKFFFQILCYCVAYVLVLCCNWDIDVLHAVLLRCHCDAHAAVLRVTASLMRFEYVGWTRIFFCPASRYKRKSGLGFSSVVVWILNVKHPIMPVKTHVLEVSERVPRRNSQVLKVHSIPPSPTLKFKVWHNSKISRNITSFIC